MKASELRLNNFVFDDDRTIKITSINNEYVEFLPEDGQYEISNLKPIPLKKYWLLKFGFKDVSLDKNGLAHRLRNVIGSMELCVYHNEGVMRLQTEASGATIQFHHIKYVHQLQNLYSALTGKELSL